MKAKPAPSFAGVSMKWISLTLLVFQTVLVILLMRYSRTRQEQGLRYLSSTAVFYAEVTKAVFSFAFLWHENGDFGTTVSVVLKSFNWSDSLRMCIPSLLYSLQNNLLFVALSNLSAAVYQVTHQMKILTTALFSVAILGKTFGFVKWMSLLVLTIGIALIQLPRGESSSSVPAQGNAFLGFISVFGGCMTSGLGGVYLEKILKQSEMSIWTRNIQLSLSGCIFAIITVLVNDYTAVHDNGFNQGYSWLVCVVIVTHSIGGLIVAICMKYADNILKCFGNAVAIVINCCLSHFLLNEFELDLQFFGGTLMVVCSTTVYTIGLPSVRAIRSVGRLPFLISSLLLKRDRKKFDEFPV